MRKTELVFNKPVYVGMSILDLSKNLMYDFHYNYIKKKYGNKSKLLFTDTDSLLYEIETEDFYADISKDIEAKFDTSSYPEGHRGIKLRCNKKVIDPYTAGARDSEKFINPSITKIEVNVDGMPNRLFSKDKYAVWIDLRTFPDNELHGSGLHLNNTKDGIRLTINRTAATECEVFDHIGTHNVKYVTFSSFAMRAGFARS
ncbi:hypothetical protein QZH41_005976 [Actinostola sp. cb2023]|nr:hypothetical protein QZH41_005976 [Actinostola sp. cb2023]